MDSLKPSASDNEPHIWAPERVQGGSDTTMNELYELDTIIESDIGITMDEFARLELYFLLFCDHALSILSPFTLYS